MKVRVFTFSVFAEEKDFAAMDQFMNTHKLLDVRKEFFTDPEGNAFWSFCVRVLPKGSVPPSSDHRNRNTERVDYREKLSPEAFARYLRLREIRKAIAEEDGTPVFVVFTNEIMAKIAELEEITSQSLLTVQGFGKKKLERYGERILKQWKHEAEQSLDSPNPNAR